MLTFLIILSIPVLAGVGFVVGYSYGHVEGYLMAAKQALKVKEE